MTTGNPLTYYPRLSNEVRAVFPKANRVERYEYGTVTAILERSLSDFAHLEPGGYTVTIQFYDEPLTFGKNQFTGSLSFPYSSDNRPEGLSSFGCRAHLTRHNSDNPATRHQIDTIVETFRPLANEMINDPEARAQATAKAYQWRIAAAYRKVEDAQREANQWITQRDTHADQCAVANAGIRSQSVQNNIHPDTGEPVITPYNPIYK